MGIGNMHERRGDAARNCWESGTGGVNYYLDLIPVTLTIVWIAGLRRMSSISLLAVQYRHH